jgi:hypothetical protein
MKNVYIEKKIGHFRLFEIDDEKIHIKQKSICDPEVDAIIDLSVLKPEPDTISYTKYKFVIVASLSVIFLILFSIIWDDFSFLRYKTLIIIAFAIYFFVCISILYKTRKKIEYKDFINKDEISIFDIGKFGEYKNDFDDFIQLIIRKIKENRCNGSDRF